MWDWAIWGALIFAFAAGIAALVLLVRRTRAAYRDFDRTHGTVARELDEVTARGEATAARAEAAAGATSELQDSLERLRVSLAQLAVLTAALDEVDQMVGRVAAVVPRK
jgi:predicted nuclease with TOPRIM domain